MRVIHAGLHDRPYTDPGIDDERLVVERNAPRWGRRVPVRRCDRASRIPGSSRIIPAYPGLKLGSCLERRRRRPSATASRDRWKSTRPTWAAWRLAGVAFVEHSVAPGSIVLTDGWKGYLPLRRRGYDHRPKTQGVATNAARLFPRIHRVFSNLKTWLRGTHHGVSPEHLPYYLDEFVFRFNRRRTPMAAFQSLLGLTSQHQPLPHNMLYGGEQTG